MTDNGKSNVSQFASVLIRIQMSLSCDWTQKKTTDQELWSASESQRISDFKHIELQLGQRNQLRARLRGFQQKEESELVSPSIPDNMRQDLPRISIRRGAQDNRTAIESMSSTIRFPSIVDRQFPASSKIFSRWSTIDNFWYRKESRLQTNIGKAFLLNSCE